MNLFRRLISRTFRRRITRRKEFRLVHTSGIFGFEFEAEHEGLNLFGFSCDEEEGPVSVFFHPEVKNYGIDLSALRELLDDVEAELLQHRREWRAMPPLEGNGP